MTKFPKKVQKDRYTSPYWKQDHSKRHIQSDLVRKLIVEIEVGSFVVSYYTLGDLYNNNKHNEPT